jgi:uncharacterized protein (UPF0371 family)
MEEVIKQAPNNMLLEDIEIIFKKNNENVLDTLFDLWNIDVKKTTDIIPEEATEADNNNIDLIDPVNKWANIRNICDAHDIEMQSLLKGLRKQ